VLGDEPASRLAVCAQSLGICDGLAGGHARRGCITVLLFHLESRAGQLAPGLGHSYRLVEISVYIGGALPVALGSPGSGAAGPGLESPSLKDGGSLIMNKLLVLLVIALMSFSTLLAKTVHDRYGE